MAGRPSKPRQQKERQGTLNERKGIINLNLQPVNELPECPKEFNKRERWFFDTVCEALFNANLLRTPDLMTIESMAGWWSILKEAQDKIRNDGGAYQVAKTGWEGMSAAITIYEKAWNKLKDFTDRYGFNLLSKDKIQVPLTKDKKDDWLQSRVKK